MANKPLLKQFGDLTPNDFSKQPVWIQCHVVDYDEPWYEETDEETFRPWTGPLPVGPEEGMLLVRANFTLADGRQLSGFITPQDKSEPLNLGRVQPQMFLPSGKRCDSWDGMIKRSKEYRVAIYDELGHEKNAIFPIRFSAEDRFAEGQTTGLIPGFCWCFDGKVEVYF